VSDEAGERPWSGQLDTGELFEHLTESATGFAIFTTDSDGLVTSWNVGGERLIGYSESEILGKSGDLIFVEEDRALGAPALERTVALRDGRAEDERWHLRKDGSVFWGSGLMMPLRGGGGFLKIMRDRTEHHLAQERLAASEERFRTLAISIPQLVFRTHSSGARSWGSPQWEVYAGLSDADSREFGWLDAVHPDDRALTIQAWTEARSTGVYSVEHRIRRHADGMYRWHQTRALPAALASGGTEEWVGTSTDIHELRGLQSRQQVLLTELQHRTRNLLALVQAIARRTLRGTASFQEFIAIYESRLAALSRVQSLIASTRKDAIALRTVIEAELEAHRDGASERVSVTGPDIEIPTASAQTLALAIYELATNAVKYGAIGQAQAHLDVMWRIEKRQSEPAGRVTLEWRERGVKMSESTAKRRKGYGSELIERALPYQLGAETKIDFGAEGICCTITVPMSSESEEVEGHD
jgi:PAS domain S-box-containing protein